MSDQFAGQFWAGKKTKLGRGALNKLIKNEEISSNATCMYRIATEVENLFT